MFQENDAQDDGFGESSSVTSDDEDLRKINGKDQLDKAAANLPPPLLAEQLDAKIKQYTRKKAKSSDTQSIKSRHSIRSTSKNIPKGDTSVSCFDFETICGIKLNSV